MNTAETETQEKGIARRAPVAVYKFPLHPSHLQAFSRVRGRMLHAEEVQVSESIGEVRLGSTWSY